MDWLIEEILESELKIDLPNQRVNGPRGQDELVCFVRFHTRHQRIGRRASTPSPIPSKALFVRVF